MLALLSVYSSYNPYIPWDTNIFEKAVAVLRANIGSGFNIGIWIFFIITGIYVVIHLVSNVGQ